MNWTTTKPTVAGWYWYKTQDEDGESIEIVQAHRSEANRIMYFYYVFDEVAYEENDMDGEWCGPLSPDDKAQGRVAGLRDAEVIAQFMVMATPDNVAAALRFMADKLEAQAAQDEKGVGE